MKKTILLLFIAMAFTGCGKKHEVTNLTGKDWYDANICFYETEDSEKFYRSVEIGTLKAGEKCKFAKKKEERYFLVIAKDINGTSIGSDMVWFNDEKTSVTRKDMFQW